MCDAAETKREVMQSRHSVTAMSIALALWLTVTNILPLLAQSAGSSLTPDITCDKPKTRVEQTVCGDATLQSMGLSVTELYSTTLSLADSPGAEVQRRFRWLQRLNECNKQRGESLKTCVQSSYEERVRELEALASDLSARAGERRATAERAAAAAQAARDFANQEAERRRVELAAQEAAAAQAAQDSAQRARESAAAQRARESAAVRAEPRYSTEDASTSSRESAQPPSQTRADAERPNDGSLWGGCLSAIAIFGLVAIVLFFLPTFVAFSRSHRNRWVILLINVVFGATGFGWIGALIWAMNKVDDPLKGGIKHDPQPHDPIV